MDKADAANNDAIENAFGTGLSTRRQGAAWTTRQGLVPRRSRTAFQTDGGQLAYHPSRHSDTPHSVSAIAWNAVRNQSGMSVRDQWNAH
ncbi:MAG: hypothetical protein KF720_23440, partial [Rubrivivax sp.]|nr:hypothetical protein [Rubrivivax sp.]